MHRTDIQIPLGAIEDWEIANIDADKMDHPFHLHAAPFQVHFKDFPGKSVYHCPVLDHEDLGMMGVVEVLA